MKKNLVLKSSWVQKPYDVKIQLFVAHDARQAFVDSAFGKAATEERQAMPFRARVAYVGLDIGIFLHSSNLSVSEIAHEAFHVTHRLMESICDEFSPDRHEPHAYLLGDIVSETVRRIWNAGIRLEMR